MGSGDGSPLRCSFFLNLVSSLFLPHIYRTGRPGGESDVAGDVGMVVDRVWIVAVVGTALMDAPAPAGRNGLFHVGGDGCGNRGGGVCSFGHGTPVSTFGLDRLCGGMSGRLGRGLAQWGPGVLEGTVAGWMGGTMGAMIAVMNSPETASVLFRVTGVLIAGVQFMVFLILSPQGN